MSKSKRPDGHGTGDRGGAASHRRGRKRRPDQTGPLAIFDPDNFLTEEKAAEALGFPVPELMALGRRWDSAHRKSGDPNQPSSPEAGLRRARISPRKYKFHRYDIREFFANSERLAQRLTLVSWRKDLSTENGNSA